MGEKTIVERVDDLYKGYPGDQPQQLDAFLSQIHTLYSDAAKRMRQHLLLILLLWGVGYLIGAGIVEEGQVAAFKVGKVESLLVAWPPLLGVISYLLSTAVMAEGTLQRVMSRAYKHVLPKVYEHDLQYLLTQLHAFFSF